MAEEIYKASTQFRAALTYASNRVDNKPEQIFILLHNMDSGASILHPIRGLQKIRDGLSEFAA